MTNNLNQSKPTDKRDCPKHLSHPCTRNLLGYITYLKVLYFSIRLFYLSSSQLFLLRAVVVSGVVYKKSFARRNKLSIFVDESTDVCIVKWLTFLIKYVNSETSAAFTELLELVKLDAIDCSAESLFSAFEKALHKKQIPVQNVIRLTCDNASVMIGRFFSFCSKLKTRCPSLITVNCICHSAALVSTKACSEIPSYIEKFIRNLTVYINSSAKRSANFAGFQEFINNKPKKMFKLCDTRWLAMHACVARILECWDSLNLFLISEVYENPKNDTADNLLRDIKKIETKAYLLFLKYILNYFNSFNAFFQTRRTAVHLLYSKSRLLFQNLRGHIIFFSGNNLLDLKNICLGFECEHYLKDHVDDNTLPQETFLEIKQFCLAFYIRAITEIIICFPLKDTFLSSLQVFDSKLALFDSNRDHTLKNLIYVAQKLGSFDHLKLKEEWNKLYYTFDKVQINSARDKDNNLLFPILKQLVNVVRSLPHSNAEAERVLSILTDVKTCKRNKLSHDSVNSIAVIKTAFKAHGESSSTISIGPNHFALMSSHNLYS
ncbi:uncharacterized protein LOC143187402 [Calliopsis andreniformis]|uniref:uncharacterized protein LOC143187402 n=1 Tax=Calliopsis andreniformis TaxID=337506 RepID=UPI003FCE5C73